MPALQSYWIKIHVVAAITATGAFMVSGVVTVLYLLKERWERGEPPLRGRAARPAAFAAAPAAGQPRPGHRGRGRRAQRRPRRA